MTIEKENKTALKEAFDAELLKQLEENPPEIPSYEKFSSMIDGEVKKRRRRIHIISTAASIALLFLAGIATFSYFAPDIQADKNPKEEIITEDGVIIEDGGWGSSEEEDNVRIIADWELVEKEKERVPELLIPRYIPEGYEFEKLTIETVETGTTTAEYVFNNGVDILEIEIRMRSNNRNSLNINDVVRTLKTIKGNVHIKEYRDTKIATIEINDGIVVNMWFNLSDEEVVNIINNMHN